MDRLEAMSLLVAAVETGSLSAAGRKLGVPLPTVSRKISDLEAHLGTRLLTRSTRSLSLTDAGGAYVAACRRILEQVGDAERAASGEFQTPKGDLVIAAPIVFGRLHVLPVITDFLAAYPEINVQLSLSDRNADLIGDHIDLAVRIGTLPDSALIATRVGEERMIVCGSPAFFAGHGTPRTPDDLSSLPAITFDGLVIRRSWVEGRAERAYQSPSLGQHSRGGSRCRNCRCRGHARAILSGRSRHRGRYIAADTDGVRSPTGPGQSAACRPGPAAAENPRLFGFRRAPYSGPAFEIER
jgi:DNA-binding transcriptional LysR family regulator